MENLYSNAILNLINAYSLRNSKYAVVLNKLSSSNEGIPQNEDIKNDSSIERLNNIITTNIEILNILRELFTKENDLFTLNRDLVKEINDRIGLTNEGLESTIEGLKPTIEGMKSSDEGLNVTNEHMKSINEGFNKNNERNKTTNDFLKEIAGILSNSLYTPEPKSEEPPPPALTPEEVREKIIQSHGILRKPFLEYFKGKYKLDKVPIRLAFIMEDIYKNSTTTQMHIKSVLRSTYTTTERAFSELRKQGWITLKSSRKNEKYILTPDGKAFVEKIVNSL